MIFFFAHSAPCFYSNMTLVYSFNLHVSESGFGDRCRYINKRVNSVPAMKTIFIPCEVSHDA